MLFSISTFGCKVNQYEGLEIHRALLEKGFLPAQDHNADIYIINTCTVTDQSDRKAKSLIEKIRRQNPNAVIALVGCFPQAFPTEASIWDADIVLGVSNKTKLADALSRFMEDRKRTIQIESHSDTFASAKPLKTQKTRAYVKIQDGCDQYCSYCIIPYARGSSRSRPLEDIRTEVQHYAENGHKEIVLTGINLCAYGKEFGLTLADAVETACEIPGIVRVRLSSLEADLLTDDMIEQLSRQKKLCSHFHLSLQSGCDATLRRMNRIYDTVQFRNLCDKLRTLFPNCAITTDVMVGFAGETDEEFEQSLSFVETIGFSRLHVFPYSVRKGTKAAEWTNQIDDETKSERYQRMKALGNSLRNRFLKSQIGTEQVVLVERRKSNEYADGLTENYTQVRIYDSNVTQHTLLKVRITDVKNGICIGVPV